ncbi:putative transporter MFS family [Candidatus Ichthyocystis hellenicum]|uniref:Putative transporter MFS family n=2 Tax=Burkholderiales genera incertae sedis TaxID=224471 RepID=A0A0S4M059_9BURK|nr:putative transporter MFS family [Candidatus Ichthyocystis hellenicum]
MTGEMKKVIFASAVGSVFEYYDFWVYVMMAPVLGPLFFQGDKVVQIVMVLSVITVTSVSRPIGGLIFGYVGDLWGRKLSFLITLVMMGIATFSIGLLPTYSTVGVKAPILLVILRVLQGLALGGEFIGASIYIAEHVKFERRGFFSAIVLSTSGIGVSVTALVLFVTRSLIDDEAFNSWGWRLPFLLSFFVFLGSLLARIKIKESPVFEKMVRESALSPSPIKESFSTPKNLKLIFLAFICVMIGESGITQSDYIIFLFLVNVLKVDMGIVDKMLICIYLLHVPILIYSGYLSDRFGRRAILLAAFLLTVLFYRPGFQYLVQVSYPAYGRAIVENPIVIHYRPTTNCEFGVWEHFLLSTGKVGYKSFNTCQETVRWLGDNVINFSRDELAAREYISVGNRLIELENRPSLVQALKDAKYMPDGRSVGMSFWKMVLISFVIMIPVSMVFGVCVAALLDMFPPRIRYTSVSFIYNMGHGLLGGLVPVIIMYNVFHFGSIYSATYYTVFVSLLGLLFSLFFYPKHCCRDD